MVARGVDTWVMEEQIGNASELAEGGRNGASEEEREDRRREVCGAFSMTSMSPGTCAIGADLLSVIGEWCETIKRFGLVVGHCLVDATFGLTLNFGLIKKRADMFKRSNLTLTPLSKRLQVTTEPNDETG